MKHEHGTREADDRRELETLDYLDTVTCSHWFTVLHHVERGEYRHARDLLTSVSFLATLAGDITPPPPPAAARLKRMGHENAGHLLAHLNEQLEMESFDCLIDECAPWPAHPESPAHILRATLNKGMRHATDEALEAVFEAAGELATAAGADHGSTEAWITGAGFAYGTVFCRLLDKMPLAELQELIEDIADEVAPDWEGDQ